MEIGKSIEIPFGAKDSELKGWEYTIPEGMEAEIKNGKIIVREKESEDERIRKALMWCVETIEGELGCHDAEGIAVAELKSWLEKQGEQKPTWSEDEKPLLEKFKQAVYDCAWGKVTCKAEGETKEEYANRWAEHFLLMVRDWADDYIDYTIQQKLRKSYDKGKEDAIKTNSPTWSEEDGKMIRIIEDAICTNEAQQLVKTKYGLELTNLADWLERQRLQNLANSEKTCKIEQKPTWSDEDERHKNTIIRAIHGAGNITPIEGELAEKWLKLFIERYTWKPSDEQMKQLGLVVELNKGNLIGGGLMTLFNDLKKLKG